MHAKGLKDTSDCQECNLNIEENIHHVLLQCTAYQNNRRSLINKLQSLGLQQITVANLLGAADLETTENSLVTQEVGTFIEKSLRIKEL